MGYGKCEEYFVCGESGVEFYVKDERDRDDDGGVRGGGGFGDYVRDVKNSFGFVSF